MIKKLLFLLFFLNSFLIFAQHSEFEKVKSLYNSFDYENVIKFSSPLISDKSLPDSLLIEVYLMRAVSFYSLGNEDSTKENFKGILKINNNYEADPSKISPKLISLFNKVKLEFHESLKPETALTDSLQNYSIKKSFDYSLFRNSLIRNIILPGTGQFFSGIKTKGSILTALSIINLAGIGYFINDTNKKEKDYLNELDPQLIQHKYDIYNKSYKTRNILFASYIVIWIYSQLDLLFFNSNDIFMSEDINAEFNSSIKINEINLSLKIPF
ncbi:hypothetical protein [Rosettibacter firmus]|uniref:hypothetical protein n=1 Tax=Rosettibacter firmus TaxID=3111522 RepID=UPI00336BC00E